MNRADLWLLRLCLPEEATAARLRALVEDQRRRGRMDGADPMAAESAAMAAADWKMDVATALGWDRPEEAHVEPLPAMLKALQEALAARDLYP